ncbi:MAG: class 3 adenylate cyclase, partial [Gammaproteobacteria bacterium]
MRDIDSWLEINHFEKYKSAFDEHDIDLEVLAELSNEDLKELGVTLGHRRKMQKLLAAAQRVAPDDPLIHADIATVASSAAEHRHLSVLFCDLADSTALSARLDVEVYRDLILGYQQACTLAIEAFGGYVARVFGDGILAYFGYPQAHEDDGERAARAALAALSAGSELPTPAQHVQLAVRIGIATGPVVVGDIVGAGASQESVVLGEVPNLAARLQSMAIPGAIVISASTRHLLGNGFAFADLGRHELKGLDGAVPVWQLLRALDNTSRFERTRGAAVTQMVGRDEELAILNKRWQHSQASEGQVVFLSGEAGIGKSCMLNAFRTQLEVGSYTPVSYQCSPFHSSTALHPIIVQLRHAADIRADDSAQSMLAKLRQVIRRSANAVDGSVLVLAELADIPLHGELVSGNKSAAQRKDQTLQALLGQLHELQVERPVLLVFEDVHWIDPTTAELIDLCVRWVCSKRVLMLITH